jgi:hypothetical protein
MDSQEVPMKKSQPLSRVLATHLPLVAAVLGMTVVFTSVVFFWVQDDSRRIYAVTVGLFILLLGIWFAANPYIKSSRLYIPLREEVDHFLSLVREMNRTAEAGDPDQRMENIKARMVESVQRMEGVAGKKVGQDAA